MSNEIKLTTPAGKEVSVDEAVGPILQKFWSKGITTQFSCSGHPNEACSQIYIVFDSNSLKCMMQALRKISNNAYFNTETGYAIYNTEFIVDPYNDMRYHISMYYCDYHTWLSQLELMYEIAECIEPLNDNNTFNNTTGDIQEIVNFFNDGVIATKFDFFVDDLYLIKDEINLNAVAENETIMLILNYDTVDSSWGEMDNATGQLTPALSIPFDGNIDVELIVSMQIPYAVDEFKSIYLNN